LVWSHVWTRRSARKELGGSLGWKKIEVLGRKVVDHESRDRKTLKIFIN